MENGAARIARSYIIYRHKRAMARAARSHEFQVTDHVPYKIIYEVLRWNMEHQCDSVAALNRIVAQGRFPDLVRDSDARYCAEVAAAAAKILDRLEDARIVIIAGPSSSGKTTTTFKLSEKLAEHGRGFKAINIDNYFFDLERHPRDEFGDYDYEPPQALDMELINRHLIELLAGRTILTPRYNFKTGVRALDVDPMTLAPNEILLIDSLHGLHDSMTAGIAKAKIFRLYIETLGQFRDADGSFMRWSDNRLLRRMLRDKAHRNLKPVQTLTHWHYVRRSELRYIIPFLKHADSIVNSALPYELPILKSRIFRLIARAKDRFQDDPKRLDAHIRVRRLYDFLHPLKSVRDDTCVPDDSLVREFIGGSRYRY
jgi:uridine kinase